MVAPLNSLSRPDTRPIRWIHIEEFAGGGGATTGRRLATGRSVDVAVNHKPEAVAMHAMNHPECLHFCQDVWKLDPLTVLEIVAAMHGGAEAVRVAIASGWFSPDCTFFSKAKGGACLDARIRGLCWILLKWCGRGAPRIRAPRTQRRAQRIDRHGRHGRGPACPLVLFMENVEEFKSNGPLHAKRDPATGRVMRRDGTVAAPGERVPVREQWLVPDPARAGLYFTRFVRWLRAFGATVDWREIRAADLGVTTTRNRLFFVIRFDGEAAIWPTPTHGEPDSPAVQSGERHPYTWTAHKVNWSLPCPSIFMTRLQARAFFKRTETRIQRPLVKNSQQRFADGLDRYVIRAEEPFFVTEYANCSKVAHQRNFSGLEPLRTITGTRTFALVAPFVAKHCTGSIGSDVREPLPTIVAGSHIKRPGGGTPLGLCTAFLAQHNGGMVGHDLREPISTLCGKGSNQAVVLAHLAKYYGNDGDPQLTEPLHTITTRDRFALVQTLAYVPPLTPALAQKARRVARWLRRHGIEVEREFAYVGKTDLVICDVGTRMFSARELFDCQGFPPDYIIDRGLKERDGRTEVVALTKNEQVMMVGNSVCPPVAAALIACNPPKIERVEAAA